MAKTDHASVDDYIAAQREELRPVRLEDRAGVLSLLEGVNAVVHLGGVSTEQHFDLILQGSGADVLQTSNSGAIEFDVIPGLPIDPPLRRRLAHVRIWTDP